ncbi:hypothetical protein ACFOGJ_16835 [Marinibaculum pumilum]|uniref:Uncharacterized protein n=1 Tax=Marinibaculum pumilum TaxID=1766165 RepID=A0ABV7L344_9PROT
MAGRNGRRRAADKGDTAMARSFTRTVAAAALSAALFAGTGQAAATGATATIDERRSIAQPMRAPAPMHDQLAGFRILPAGIPQT